MDTELGRLITIGAFVVIGLGVFVLVAWLLLRCTVSIGDRLSLAAGARVRVRGVPVPLPDNEVREMQLWIG
ncbi:MAG: hypothetical protein IT379_00570 [Deltaproteobacteria bacterium]|nr:hypothetical protein [Deltaproteobacteria bacterium]